MDSTSTFDSSVRSEHGALPLAPLDRPSSLFVRLLFWMMKKRYGIVPTAFRVIYARSPFLAFVSLVLYTGIGSALRIEPSLQGALQLFVSTEAGCTFCSDLQLAEAARSTLGLARFRDLLSFEEGSAFTPREKAALSYARALQRSLHIPDSVWSALSVHFSERERVDIVWICAVERYFNALALPLRIGSDHLAPAPSGATSGAAAAAGDAAV